MNAADLAGVLGIPDALKPLLGFIPQALALITDEEQRIVEFAAMLAELRAGKVPSLITQVSGGTLTKGAPVGALEGQG